MGGNSKKTNVILLKVGLQQDEFGMNLSYVSYAQNK